MALYYPDILEHNNPNYALIEDLQIRGGAISVENILSRNAIPIDKRKAYTIASYVDNEIIVTKRFDSILIDDTSWHTESNWTDISSSTNSGSNCTFFDGGRAEEIYLFEDTIECGSSNDIQNVYIDCGESIRIL